MAGVVAHAEGPKVHEMFQVFSNKTAMKLNVTFVSLYPVHVVVVNCAAKIPFLGSIERTH